MPVLQFEGIPYPVLERPVCIHSEDIVTLVQLEGIAELDNLQTMTLSKRE